MASSPVASRGAVLFCLAALMAPVFPALGQPDARPDAAAPLPPLAQQVLDAYAAINTYEARVGIRIEQDQGRWVMIKQGVIRTAFDREKRSLLLDTPDYSLMTDGRQTTMSVEQIPDRHVEALAPPVLTYETLTTHPATQPIFRGPPLIDALMLTAQSPFAVLTSNENAAIRTGLARGIDGKDYPTLMLGRPEGSFTLLVDPETHLLKEVKLTITLDPMMAAQATGPAPRFHWILDVKSVNEPLAADTFRFDATDSTAFASVEQMIQHAQQQAPVMLPALDGEPVNLGDAGDDVLVLMFWRSDAALCVEALGQLQRVRQWATQQNVPARVYAINVGEAPEQIRAFLAQHGVTVPVLLDPQGQMATGIGIQSVPATIVLHRRAPVGRYMGQTANLDEAIQRDIESVTRQPQAQPEN